MSAGGMADKENTDEVSADDLLRRNGRRSDEARKSWKKRWARTGHTQKRSEEAGRTQAGEALHPTSTATTVRVRDGKIDATDGPFAETKEQLGGYYVVDCKNLDEAIQWAAKIPHASIASYRNPAGR